MAFTLNTLRDLKDSGKEIGIFSEELIKEIKKYFPKDFPNFSSRTYYYWVSGKKPVPLSIALKIMKKFNKIKIERFSVGGGNKIIFPEKTSKELSYLIGLILGDGCLVHTKRGSKRNTYYIQISFRNLEKAKKIKKLIFNLFEIDSSIYKGKGCFNVCTFSKPLIILLSHEYKIPMGIKYKLLKVPKKIEKSSSLNKKNFIKGVFESDGNIYLHKGKKAVQLRQKSKQFLDELRDLLKKEKLEFNPPYRDNANNSWLLWSSKKELVDNFIKKIINLKSMPG